MKEERRIILSEYGDAVVHRLDDKHELVGNVGTHNKCGGEMFAVAVHAHKAIACHKCGWRTTALLGVSTIGKLKETFRCYNKEKEMS